jgi:hypothetical protein
MNNKIIFHHASKVFFKLLVFLFFVVNTLNTFAQKVDFGFKGGINASTLWGGMVENEKSSFITGVNIGMFMVHKINENVSVQPELMFSQQGNKTDYGWGEYKNRKNCLVMPVLLKYISTLPVDLLVGPQFNLFDFKLGMNLGAEYKFTDHFNSGARINLGLSKDEGDHRDFVFQLYIAYRGFDFAKLFEPM